MFRLFQNLLFKGERERVTRVREKNVPVVLRGILTGVRIKQANVAENI